MASPSLNSQACYHTRSNSLPSRPHPLTSQFTEHLCRLNASQSTISSLSSSFVCHKLSCIQDLHDCADKLILLPLTQKSLGQEQNENCFDDILDGSVGVLDVCTVAKDALLQTKERAQELQSIMRRRRASETAVSNEIKKYLASRNVVKKTIRKGLRDLKAMEKNCSLSSYNKDHETVAMLTEMEAVTLTVLESLLTLISGGSRSQSKQSGWSLVSKLMHPKRVAFQEEGTEVNEFEKLDSVLQSLIHQKTDKSNNTIPVQNAQHQLKAFDLSIQELEQELDCLYRRLIKTRVSLLNSIVN